MERNNSTANLARFMHGLTTVFAGLQEMFASITEQMTLAMDATELLDEAAKEAVLQAEADAAAEAVLPKYTTPVQKPKTTRKRAAAKKAEPVEPVAEETTEAKAESVEEQEESEEDALPFNVEPETEPPSGEDEKSAEAPSASSITKDMITKTVVAKIKKKRGNSEAIGKLVKAYGVAQLSDLQEEKYEAFLNDLSQL